MYPFNIWGNGVWYSIITLLYKNMVYMSDKIKARRGITFTSKLILKMQWVSNIIDLC